jgi:beta-lactamase superfamily II metal-dependent hydrolase
MNCEIEFLPVGASSKPGDAIVIRYGFEGNYALMVVDGGTLETGDDLVKHLRLHFGQNVSLEHVLLTHPDADHASGLRTLLEQISVKNLWLHVPWLHAAEALPYFANKSWTEAGLSAAIKKEYELIAEIVDTAVSKGVKINPAFAGNAVGPFRVLSPSRELYVRLLPQFDRTPAPDQAELESEGVWIGKQLFPASLFAGLMQKVGEKIQKWVPESWNGERLKEGGKTSATNESSVVLYGTFPTQRVLLTGDAGVWGLTHAANHADGCGLPLQNFNFVQIPHHGSRRNVGPLILNRILGPIRSQYESPRFEAFVSAPAEDDSHPRKMVLNAFIRRGGRVTITQGGKKIYYGGFPRRPNYSDAVSFPFSPMVEEYD